MNAWQVVKVGNRTIRAKDHRSEVVVVLRSDNAGAVLKPSDRLRVVHRTIPSDCPLTPRQLDALKRVAAGLSYQEIAAAFGIEPQTLRNLLSRAYRRLDVSDRSQAVLKAVGEGWI